jgi:hypothetical protein
MCKSRLLKKASPVNEFVKCKLLPFFSPFKYSIKGASLGGPIIKNKVFFYISAEQVRQDAPATSLSASDASHAPGGNYSQANADTLAALASFLKTKFNYDPGAFQGYSFQTNSDKVTAKLDWNINAKNWMSKREKKTLFF